MDLSKDPVLICNAWETEVWLPAGSSEFPKTLVIWCNDNNRVMKNIHIWLTVEIHACRTWLFFLFRNLDVKCPVERAMVPESLKSFGGSLSVLFIQLLLHSWHNWRCKSAWLCVFSMAICQPIFKVIISRSSCWSPFCSFTFLWHEGDRGMAPAFSEYD